MKKITIRNTKLQPATLWLEVPSKVVRKYRWNSFWLLGDADWVLYSWLFIQPAYIKYLNQISAFNNRAIGSRREEYTKAKERLLELEKEGKVDIDLENTTEKLKYLYNQAVEDYNRIEGVISDVCRYATEIHEGNPRFTRTVFDFKDFYVRIEKS